MLKVKKKEIWITGALKKAMLYFVVMSFVSMLLYIIGNYQVFTDDTLWLLLFVSRAFLLLSSLTALSNIFLYIFMSYLIRFHEAGTLYLSLLFLIVSFFGYLILSFIIVLAEGF